MGEVEEIKRLLPISNFAGSKNKALCPVRGHDDKKPSCDIDHAKNLWHCKVCDIGGDIFNWVMESEAIKFEDALEKLAGMAGVPLGAKTEEAQLQYEKEQRIQKARLWAVEYYHQNLLKHQGGLAYWSNRAITLDTVKKMKLGWSDGHLLDAVLQAGLDVQDFKDAGLITEKEDGGAFDWFDIRSILPMFSRSGKVLNISGRKTDYSSTSEKYRHLKGSKIETFYNESALNNDEVWIFEGHPDTLTAIQMGVPAIGIVGTSGLTCPEKLAGVKKIVICPDNDEPGLKAADEWARLILEVNKSAKITFFKLPKEANDFNEWAVLHSGDSHLFRKNFDQLVSEAVSLIDYKISQVHSGDDLVTLWPYLRQLPEITRESCFKRLKERLPGYSLLILRKAYREWASGVEVPSIGGQISDIVFEEEIPWSVNVDFTVDEEKASGHVCLYGQVKRNDENGAEIISYEPVLIESEINLVSGNVRPKMTALSEMPMAKMSRSVPMKSAVKDRWSDASIKAFLSGEFREVKTSSLIDRMAGFFRTYIWFKDPANYEILALYAMGTYLARIFGAYPYLAINGLKRTGKSNTLEMLEQLCFNAQQSVNSSLSATFRMIESSFITWIRDEAEQFNTKNPENQDELTILNSGYKQGATVKRVDKSAAGQMEVQEFNVFSPKIFGGINILNSTLLDRSILIESFRASKETVSKMPRMNQMRRVWMKEAKSIRDSIYIWALTKFPQVKAIYEEFPADEDIINREWEVWLPMLSMAYLADIDSGNVESGTPGYTAKVKEFALTKIAVKKNIEKDETFEIKILETLHAVISDAEVYCIYDNPGWYSVNELALKISEYLENEGAIQRLSKISAKKLFRILVQTEVIDQEKDRKQIKKDGKNCRCVFLDLAKVLEIYRTL